VHQATVDDLLMEFLPFVEYFMQLIRLCMLFSTNFSNVACRYFWIKPSNLIPQFEPAPAQVRKMHLGCSNGLHWNNTAGQTRKDA